MNSDHTPTQYRICLEHHWSSLYENYQSHDSLFATLFRALDDVSSRLFQTATERVKVKQLGLERVNENRLGGKHLDETCQQTSGIVLGM